jgi:hypothetical protein
MNGLYAFLAGLLFGIGLLLSGMTDPQRVLGFLDVAGAWNPALAFTMGGAIAVAAPGLAWLRRARVATSPDAESDGHGIDRNLLAGSATFGVGWGMSGLCPGPSLMLLTYAGAPAFAFVAAMAVGMLLLGIRRGPDS